MSAEVKQFHIRVMQCLRSGWRTANAKHAESKLHRHRITTTLLSTNGVSDTHNRQGPACGRQRCLSPREEASRQSGGLWRSAGCRQQRQEKERTDGSDTSNTDSGDLYLVLTSYASEQLQRVSELYLQGSRYTAFSQL